MPTGTSFGARGACAPGEVCALPQARSAYKVLFWVVIVLVLVALLFAYVLPLSY